MTRPLRSEAELRLLALRASDRMSQDERDSLADGFARHGIDHEIFSNYIAPLITDDMRNAGLPEQFVELGVLGSLNIVYVAFLIGYQAGIEDANDASA